MAGQPIGSVRVSTWISTRSVSSKAWFWTGSSPGYSPATAHRTAAVRPRRRRRGVAVGDGAPSFEEAEGPFDCVSALVGVGAEFTGRPPREPRRLRFSICR